MPTGQIALLIAALFAGAALYVSIAEHPARIAAGEAAGLAQWKPSYRRAKLLQGGLALIGGAIAFALWWRSLNQLWLIGALLLLANWPWTLLAMRNLNRRLETAEPGPESGELLARWGRLHAVRTLLGLASAIAMLAALNWRL
ncbi:MAG TPA: DUF1772 domain-containing protein [Allosphingosinicella sp.]